MFLDGLARTRTIAGSGKSRVVAPLACGILALGLCLASPASAETTESLVATLTSDWQSTMENSQYMHQNPQSVTWPGYEGYSTEMCTYYMTDRSGDYAGQRKKAKVVLLDIPVSMMARWVVNAFIDVTGSVNHTEADNMMQTILYASGGQFAVSGMVYEDMDGTGAYTLYCFRDGLTCGLGGGFPNNTKAPLNDTLINEALYNDPTSAKSYARIISSTREMYEDNGGTQNVDGLNFPPVIREVYKKALDTGHNEIFEGWVRANYKPNQSPAVGIFPYLDNFPSSGRQLSSYWLDHYTFHVVKPFTPASPGGDGSVMLVRDPSGGVDTSSLGSANATNYKVECDIYCQYRPELASNGYERVGIFARDTGGVFDWSVSGVSGNNYLMSWDSDDGRFRCAKCVDGTLSDLLPSATYLKSSGWRHMAIQCVDDLITYSLDGDVKLSIHDSTFSKGKFGIGYREAYSTNANMIGTRADNFAARVATNSGVEGWSLY